MDPSLGYHRTPSDSSGFFVAGKWKTSSGFFSWTYSERLFVNQVLPSDPFGCFKWPFKGLSDLHLGYQKVTWKKLEKVWLDVFLITKMSFPEVCAVIRLSVKLFLWKLCQAKNCSRGWIFCDFYFLTDVKFGLKKDIVAHQRVKCAFDVMGDMQKFIIIW